MSNKDSNGIELPWILHKEPIPIDQWSRLWIPGLTEQIRYKIIPNPEHSLYKKQQYLNSDSFALMCCMRDSILHSQMEAAKAVHLHIQDAWKWKE